MVRTEHGRSLREHARWLGGFLIAALMTSGCVRRSDLEQMKKDAYAGWQAALCTRDARLLLRAVEAECRAGTCSSADQDVLRRNVCSRDPMRRERFLQILAEQPQEIFFLYSNAKALSRESRERLRSVIFDTPLLPTTRFLVVARPSHKEEERFLAAQRRGYVLRAEIVRLIKEALPRGTELPPDDDLARKRTLVWTYEFPLLGAPTGAVARGAPKLSRFENWSTPNEEASEEKERGTWVFRVDC